MTSFLNLIRFGRHDLIEFGISGEVIGEGNDGIAIKEQALTFPAVGDIGQLIFGNVEVLGENLLIATGLIEHIDEIRVIENILNLPGSQKVFHILGNGGWNTTPFAEAFPDLHGICRGLLFPQHQVKLILIKPGCLPGCPVAGNPVPDLILNHQHAQFLELLSQFADVKTNQAVLGVYIGLVVEDLVGTFDIDFQHRCQVFRVRFAHFQQTRVKVFQDGQVFRDRILQILLIDQLDATVNWGREKMPSWYYNLRATPRASVLVDGKQKVYSVREAQAEEYEHYWKLAEATYLGMSKYRQRVGERRIPIMILSEERE